MKSYDCVILYNTVNTANLGAFDEKLYPANIVREEVGAIEESLRQGGFHPCVIAVERFSRDLVEMLADIVPKFVFNLCEEINGKCEMEMCVAGLLELMEIPYTGSDPLTLGLALNKSRVKNLLRSAGIPTPRAFVAYPGMELEIPRAVRSPFMVKPSREDGSLGINSRSVCHTKDQLRRQVQYIHEFYKQEALVEEYLDGREFNVSLIGEHNPEVLAISEIDFTGMPEEEPRIVSYRAKWDEESIQYNCTVPICPAQIPKRLENRICDLAIRSYRSIGCRDYARIDLRADSHGHLYVLEVNPNPDISPKAGFARAARVAGYSYTEIIMRISEAAMKRGGCKTAAVYAT